MRFSKQIEEPCKNSATEQTKYNEKWKINVGPVGVFIWDYETNLISTE